MSENQLSRKIAEYCSKKYFITAAEWNGIMGKSYEIGIRQKDNGRFFLFQGDFNHQSVQEVANAIAHILNIETENYDAEWCMEHFK